MQLLGRLAMQHQALTEPSLHQRTNQPSAPLLRTPFAPSQQRPANRRVYFIGLHLENAQVRHGTANQRSQHSGHPLRRLCWDAHSFTDPETANRGRPAWDVSHGCTYRSRTHASAIDHEGHDGQCIMGGCRGRVPTPRISMREDVKHSPPVQRRSAVLTPYLQPVRPT